MLKNYLKIAFRNLIKYKSYSLINIIGLASSTAVAILMFIYAWNVLTYDQFHENSEDIYFLHRDRPGPEGATPVYDTWYPMLTALQTDYPEIISGSRTVGTGNLIRYQDKEFNEDVEYVDKEHFSIFSFPFKQGNPETALDDISSVVISNEMAVKFFGNDDPMGKVLSIGGGEYKVSGVLDDFPPNSTFNYSFVAPLHQGLPFMPENGWDASFLFTFLHVKKGTDPQALEAKFPEFVEKYMAGPERGDLHLIALKDYNDEFTNQRRYAYILLIISLGIILIASINFTNLATSHSMIRTKEVGVRKVLGATRGRLISQFMTEALVMSLMALIIGAAMADLLLPTFNELVDMELILDYFTDYKLVFSILGLGVLIGLISGTYPSLFLSRLQPNAAFRGGDNSSPGGIGMRNVLVIFQFALSIFLICGIGVIIKQIDFMKTQSLNFNQEQVVAIPVSARSFDDVDDGVNKMNVFKNELAGISGVTEVSASNSVPGRYRGWFALFLAEGQKDRAPFDWKYAIVESDYFTTYDISLVEGRHFREGSEADREKGAIINESAMKAIGWTTAVGKKLIFPDNGEEMEIIGVVKDFHYQSLQRPIEPLVHFYSGEESRNYFYVSAKIEQASMSKTLPAIREKITELDLPVEAEPFFPDDNFAEMYEAEENMARIISFATILAIIIASLGLYALASFTILQRTKEIAIRKILGASGWGIMLLVSKRFAVLVGIAFVIAVPIAWYFSGQWLQEFAYRMEPGAGIFLLAGLGALLIALLTVSYHSIKAANLDPIESLRYE